MVSSYKLKCYHSAHEHKDMSGIDEDNVLQLLTEETKVIYDRNKTIKKSRDSFDKAYIEKFNRDVDGCPEKGWKENEALGKRYGWDFERAQLRRISKHRKNYFMWLSDFSISVTNNLSERGLRGVKSHMKISGQFE